MTTPSEQILKARYQIAVEGGLVGAIKKAVTDYNALAPTGSPQFSASQLLAIGSRETGYLWGSHYGRFHDWAILGDSGHGHGVFQIDDRSHADFTSTKLWRDPYSCATRAIEILNAGNNQLVRMAGDAMIPPVWVWNELVFAAYNCGPANAWKGYINHADPSIFTTNHDYGKDVLAQVEIFGRLMEGA